MRIISAPAGTIETIFNATLKDWNVKLDKKQRHKADQFFVDIKNSEALHLQKRNSRKK